MADDKHPDDKRPDDKHHEEKKADKKAEDLTPTPTQAEMDKIMSGLSDEDLAKAKKPEAKEAKEGVEVHHPTPESHPPHMTQAENDAAMAAAAPGSVPPEGSTDPQKRKEKDEAEAKRKKEDEEKRKKDMEAEHPPGYQTRNVVPPRK